MDNTLQHYIHLGVGLLVAVAVLSLCMAGLRLRRDTGVSLEQKQYYKEMAKYKQQFDDLDKNSASAIEVVSMISQYADDVDIYVVGLSTDSGATMLVNSENRIMFNKDNISNNEAKVAIGSTYITADMITRAQLNGPMSLSVLGQIFFGEDHWKMEICYDGKDVTDPSSVNRESIRSRITGLRFIKE